jgi:predicted DNA-binding transcriptional regulator YafY
MKNKIISAEEERDIVDSTERGEWKSIGRVSERRRFWRDIALNTLTVERVERTVLLNILKAIEGKLALSFSYKSSQRTVEPYILGFDDRHQLMLSAVQLSGGSGTGFRTFYVSELSNLAVTERKFYGKHPDYNPRDPLFEEKIAQVAA